MSPLVVALFLLGFVLLIGGAEWLVRGASRLAVAVGISPLVVGLTVVAFGTSAPELAVSLRAAFAGQTGLAIGNVVGSNICNVLLILGIGAMISPLFVERQLVRRDVPLMIGASLLLFAMALDGQLDRLNGLLLFAAIIAYTLYAVISSRRAQRDVSAEASSADGNSGDSGGGSSLALSLLQVMAGLVLLVLGAQWLVDGAVEIALFFGVSDLIIGLTVVAFGTSLPELAATVVACLRGQGSIAVGNVVGSNLFNILLVLGLTSIVSSDGIPASPALLSVDLPIMIAASLACLPIFFTGYLIARWEGALFLAFYVLYIGYLTLIATDHSALELLSSVALVVLPLTFMMLLGLAWRSRHQSHQ